MDKRIQLSLILASVLVISGCAVRTYSVTKERVDQNLTGNRGYLQGSPSQAEQEKGTTTRKSYVLEFEFGQSKAKDSQSKQVKKEVAPEYDYQTAEPTSMAMEEDFLEETTTEPTYEDYLITKDDTLQKISKKFYGTYRKWKQIYDANTDKIKDPNKIKPGITIRIPK